MRQPLVSAPRRDDAEAGGPRPVDEIADERRLIAEGEAVNDARLRGATREQWSAERVGFDRDVDHVLAVVKRGEAMLHGGERVSCTFDDDIDPRMRDERFPVVGDVRGSMRQCRIERCSAVALGDPPDAREVGPGIRRREVRDSDDVHAWRLRHLREIHRPELARPDHADDERPALSGAFTKLRIQTH